MKYAIGYEALGAAIQMVKKISIGNYAMDATTSGDNTANMAIIQQR